MVSVQTYIPAALAPFIKSFWCLRVDAGIQQPYVEDIIPDGHHEIIFHMEPHIAQRNPELHNCGYEPDAFFAGQNLYSYMLQLQAGAMLYGIRFYPHTLALLFNFPADLLTGQLLPLNDVPAADALRHCITENPARTFARFEKLLTKQVAALNTGKGFDYVNAAVGLILQEKGNVKVDRLIQATGVSVKHLDTSFKKFVGITPKTLCHIIKLNYFIHYREQHPGKSLTDCTYEASFYDQSHLIKLFKTFTGKLPKAYFNEVNIISNHFTGM